MEHAGADGGRLLVDRLLKLTELKLTGDIVDCSQVDSADLKLTALKLTGNFLNQFLHFLRDAPDCDL